MNMVSVERLLDIGIALSKEKDGHKLFELILTAAMDITNCDGGTLYRKEGESLAFQLMFTRSTDTKKGGRYEPIQLPPVPLNRQYVCSCAVLDGTLINIHDVYESENYDFSGPKNYDALTGYRTKSMLVVPMEDDGGNCIGVLQLINALDTDGLATIFDESCEQVIFSLACQTAICQVNRKYAAEIQELLDSLVRVMSTTIDALTPYNANHTRNMVKYGTRFVDWLAETGNPWQFDPQMKRQFLMSVWLHDSGKITVPLQVMDKKSRLGDGLERILTRLEIVGLRSELSFQKGTISREEYETCKTDLQAAEALIQKVNLAGFLHDEWVEPIHRLAERTYVDETGHPKPWVTPDEQKALLVRKGTLTEDERRVMEDHVVMTDKMLQEIQFPENYAKVKEWAASHHEFLNGTGYPKGLRGQEISREVRLLTILDIFDALTARDRPYKPSLPPEKALAVLDSMEKEGKLDSQVLDLFRTSRVWEME